MWNDGAHEACACGPFSQETSDRLRAQIELQVTHPEAFCLAAEVGQVLAGFLTCSMRLHPIKPGRWGEIEELYVRPAYRRQGIGAQLVRSGVELLRSQDAGVILALCDRDNPAALAFWRSQTWVEEMILFKLYQ